MKNIEESTTKTVNNNNYRHINLEGAHNFRDLGGYIGSNGKKVKHGVFFRSDELSNLSVKDLETLKNLNLKTIIDFRAPAERNKNLDKTPETLSNIHLLSIDLANKFESLWQGEDRESMLVYLMETANKKFVEDCISQYREFFKIVSSLHSAPLVFHCTAGKDRTGFAAALLLAALGVNEKDIMDDYLISANYVEKRFAEKLEKNPKIFPLITVKSSYLQSAFDEIKANYTSITSYIQKELGADIESLRNNYLE